ncbi:hypothetical protein ACOSP7_008951 [Xanthoceras sorbifolium]
MKAKNHEYEDLENEKRDLKSKLEEKREQVVKYRQGADIKATKKYMKSLEELERKIQEVGYQQSSSILKRRQAF